MVPCVCVLITADVIEEGIESGGVACDVGTKPKDECLNNTSSSFDTVEIFSSVSLIMYNYTCIQHACTYVHVNERCRRKEKRNKQGHTNNKAKQHNTPKAVTFHLSKEK